MEKEAAEKAFVVMGRSLEAALDKAAIVLHWPKERIAYEILQEPKPGKYGQPPVECKLRVTPVAPAADEMSPSGGLAEEEALLHVDLPLKPEELAWLSCEMFLVLIQPTEDENANAAEIIAEATTPVLREIFGDVGMATGAIDHDGDLIIHGHVLKGMTVRASGTINIHGNVETAFVDAGGDITIDGGLLGTVRSARGGISCRFAQGAQIDAPRGNIHVRESAMHAQIHADDEVMIGSILLGGSCYGELRVQVQTAGTPSGVPTVIMAGRNAALYEKMEHIRARALRHIERLGDCERVRLELLPSEESGHALSAGDRVRLWQAMIRRNRLSDDLRMLTREKSHLLGMINAEHGSRICIEGCVHPKVKVLVDDAGLEVRALTQFATFSKDYETGELRTTPLH